MPSKYYYVYGSPAGQIIMEDSTLPYLQDVAKKFPNIAFRAIAKTASLVSKTLKKELRMGAPGGAKVKPLEKARKTRGHHSREKGRKGYNAVTLSYSKTNKKPYQNLVNAIGYKASERTISARIGWLSKSSARLGSKLQSGWTQPISQKQRAFFRYRRLPLKPSTSQIKVPARPVFQPFFAAHKADIPKIIMREVDVRLKRLEKQHLRAMKRRFVA